MARLHMQLSSMQDPDSSASDNSNDDDDQLLDPTDDEEEKSSNEVFMLLTGEQDLIKFLHWAMKLLATEASSDSPADTIIRDVLWKKLNLSGHLEPPLIVDEPQFVLVRREKLLDGYHLGDETTKEDDPFIPPRGRKHNNPDLDALFNRYETFVPNRGRRDKVKDLFKYDDLFFPNRGKKYRSIFKLDDPFFPNRGKKLQLRDLYKIDDPFFPNRGKRHLTGSTKTPPPSGLWGKLLQQQQQQERKLPDDSDNWPQRMSTHKINGYDQSVKPSMSQVEDAAILASRARARATPTPTATATAAEGAQWRGLARGLLQPANRLHSTRSMSANLQQPELGMEMEQLVPHLPLQQQSSVHFIGNPIMPRQQVKPSWLGSGSGSASGSLHRFRRSLRPDNAPETQLTRSTNANPQKIDSGSDSDAEWDWDTDDANWSDI
ncbi:GL23508 [Drosophila persimilis]|uniref:GL23508 n=1 Tax=Drosophila persimilis TaxID=7234 RepID=B4G319_DROPE|nr:GL23508 [Drosophila persimilis]